MKALPLFGLLFAVAGMPASSPHTGACLGRVCLDTGSVTEDLFVQRHGPGVVVNSGSTHCYVVAPNLYFAISADSHSESNRAIEWVYVGYEPWLGCTSSSPAKRPIRDRATPEGLRVGSSEARLLTLYSAAPVFVRLATATGALYTISADPENPSPITEVTVVGKRVHSILVSAQE